MKTVVAFLLKIPKMLVHGIVYGFMSKVFWEGVKLGRSLL